VENLALPGSNSQSILGTLEDSLRRIGRQIDVFILNYSDNDRNFFERDTRKISAGFEVLVRHLLSRPNHPVVWNIEINNIQLGDSPLGVYDGHLGVLRHYGIPSLNFDMSVRTNFSQLPAQVRDVNDEKQIRKETFWHKQRHPPWPAHQILADFIAHVWKSEADKFFCAPPSPHLYAASSLAVPPPMVELADERHALSVCFWPETLIRGDAHRLSYNRPHWHAQKDERVATIFDKITFDRLDVGLDYNAGDAGKGLVLNGSRSSWQFGEEEGGNQKRGWWVDQVSGHQRIVFELSASKRESLNIAVGILTSYQYMGSAILSLFHSNPLLDGAITPAVQSKVLSDPYATVRLNALSTTHNASQTSMSRLCVNVNTTVGAAIVGTVQDYRELSTAYPACEGDFRGVSEPFFRFPACGARRAAGPPDHCVNSSTTVQGAGVVFLQVELAPASNLQAKHNRFKLLWVSSC